MLNERIYEIIENNGFAIHETYEQDGQCCAEINNSTPEGEDWWETIWFDGTDEGFIEKVKERSAYFNVDEEVEPYVSMRDKKGIPSSISALLEDAKWKENELRKLAIALSAIA